MNVEKVVLAPEEVSGVIETALSDHVSFANIEKLYGSSEKQMKRLMRDTLKTGSYRAWRKRVHEFGSRREFYK